MSAGAAAAGVAVLTVTGAVGVALAAWMAGDDDPPDSPGT